MHIAKVDQRSGITEFTLHQEVTDLQRVIVSCLLDNAFNLLEVAHASAALNVLEVDVVVLGVGQHIHQEEEKTFVGTEGLENGNDFLGV